MKKIYLLLPLLILLITTCNSVEPPGGLEINLKLEDVSCTEAWITLTINNLQLPSTLILYKNSVAQNTILCYGDTLLYIDSLLPNQTYKLQAAVQQSSNASNEITVTTMDTTSHNFSFETFTFGGTAGSSTLYDVAIVGSEIWAVGEIYVADTSINGYTMYNAVHWDGSEWELKRITVIFRGNLITPPLEGAFAFSGSDIWFVGSLPIHGDGENWIMYDLRTTVDPNLSLSKAWGSSSNDMYFVGRNGSIAHYNGSNWGRIESGTDVDIQDIWGIDDGVNDPFILCAASNVFDPGEHKILKISNTQVDSIKWDTGRRLHSVWFNSQEKLYTSGGGVFFGSAPSYSWKEQTDLPLFYTERVRGKGKNDLFVVGDFGLLAHYNGVTWKTYPEAATAEAYSSLDYKNNLMVTVGLTYTQAVVQFMFHN